MSATAFVLGAAVAALVGAGALFLWTAGGDVLAAGWAIRGFLAMALPSIAGGAWLVREHGRDGSWFVAAVLAGFVVRLLLAAVAALGAAQAGGSAKSGLIAGLAAGFVPLMAFETVWFARSHRAQGVAAETRG